MSRNWPTATTRFMYVALSAWRWSWDSSVNTVTGLRTGWLSILGSLIERRNNTFSSAARQAAKRWGSNKPLSSNSNATPFTTVIKHVWSPPPFPYVFTAWCLIQYRHNFPSLSDWQALIFTCNIRQLGVRYLYNKKFKANNIRQIRKQLIWQIRYFPLNPEGLWWHPSVLKPL